MVDTRQNKIINYSRLTARTGLSRYELISPAKMKSKKVSRGIFAACYFLLKKSDYESVIDFNHLSRLEDRTVVPDFNTP